MTLSVLGACGGGSPIGVPFAYLGGRLARELGPRMLVASSCRPRVTCSSIQRRSTANPELSVELAARTYALFGAQF